MLSKVLDMYTVSAYFHQYNYFDEGSDFERHELKQYHLLGASCFK